MRITTQIALPVLLLALFACGDGTTSPLLRVQRSYVLESVDDLPLPATFESDDVTLTALSGFLTLDSIGSTTWVTNVHQSPDNFGDGNFVTSIPGEYRFRGDSIEIGYFGRCRDLCIENRLGVTTDSTLSLYDPIFMGGSHSFRYRLVNSVP